MKTGRPAPGRFRCSAVRLAVQRLAATHTDATRRIALNRISSGARGLPLEFILLGTATSVGIPMLGCDCKVCTSENPRNRRTRCGVVLRTEQGNLVIDTPPELRLQLIRERIDIVHAAVYTHSHADHMFGLDDLRICGHRLERPIPLYCEERVERQIRTSFNYAFADGVDQLHQFAVPRLGFERIGPEPEPFEVLGQTIKPIRLMHGSLPVFGFRINNVAYCTDVSQIPEASWPLLEGLDVLVLDCLRWQPHPTHLCVDQALEIIGRVQPRMTYLTHISHKLEYEETNSRLPAGVELAYDGLRFPC